MKTGYLKFILLVLLPACTGIQDTPNESNLKIKSVICEYLDNPLGIDVVNPRLSWKMYSDEKSKSQSAYRILVSSSIEKLENNQGDLWDTGKTESDKSVHIIYKGTSLRSRQKCFWKVKVWDEAGDQSTWSEVASWEMALLKKEDWQATWIEAPRVYNWTKHIARIKLNDKRKTKIDYESAPYLRKTFSTEKAIKKARVYISGLGLYVFYINGKKIGDHVLDPTFTNFDKRVHYITYDVTKNISSGINTLGVLLGDGWYNVHSRAVWGFNKAAWRDRPTCLLQLEIEYEDGTVDVVLTDESWKTAPSPTIYNDIRQGEKYDARLEIANWNRSILDASLWIPVREKAGPKGTLVAQMMPANKIMRTVTPVAINSPKPGVYIVDMGQNFAGWIRLNVKGDSGNVVNMKFGEVLNDDGTLNQYNVSRHHRETEFQVAEYTLNGKGLEVWEPKFTYFGFQYVEITGYPGQLTIDDIVGKVVHTSFETSGSFTCSNDIINKIHNATDWSFISNFLGYPTDCPQREKNGWTGDAHLAAETGLLTYKTQMAYTKWLYDCQDAQLENGLLPGIVPTSGWGYTVGDWVEYGFGPAWDGAYVWIPWYLYSYSGDTQVLDEHYFNMKKSIEYMSDMAENHILDIGLGDWVFIDTYAPRALTSTACYYDQTAKFAEMASLLNKKEDAIFYAELARSIKKAFNERFYNEKEKTYADEEQTSLAAALYFDLIPDNNDKDVVTNLANIIIQNDTLLDCGVLGAKWIPHALSDNGFEQLAFDISKNTRFPGWGYWMENGATTLWEDFNINSKDNSRNHMFFGDIVQWCYKVLGGIRLDEDNPMFKHFFIEPFFANSLDFTKASHDCMYGMIRSEWKRVEGRVELSISIPVNTTSTIILPKREILINDLSLSESNLVMELSEVDEKTSFTLGSGNYQIIL